MDNNEKCIGRICEIQKNTYFIRFDDKELTAKLKGSFYNEGSEVPVVGDYVDFIFNPYGDSTIIGIRERKSVLTRPDHSGHAVGYVKTMLVQTMVSNIDYAFIVTSLNDNYNFNRVARYVSIAISGNAIPVVILTKSDLCNSPGRYIREIEELSDKVKVHAISALYGIGLDELQEYIKPGVTVALIGSSGVGKSTLINALAGKDIMKTSEIREDDSKGRHTTTYRQMIFLDNGAAFIDTPGMREIGVCDAEEGISDTFSDIVELEAKCKFSDCRHETEPGCAIKAAIKSGELSLERYELYKGLSYENLSTQAMRAKKEEWAKNIAIRNKERMKTTKNIFN